MKFSVHCEGTPEECVGQLKEVIAALSGASEESSPISIAEIKAKRGRKPKKEEEPAEEVEADDESEEDDISKDEPEADEEDFDDEEESEDEEDEKLSESDLTKLKAALKNYSAKVNKKKAVDILHKYAERSDLVKPADLPKLLKALKV